MSDDLNLGRNKIRATYNYLVDNINVVSTGLAGCLFQKGVLNIEQHQKVTNRYDTDCQQVRYLLEILYKKKEPDTYQKFREALLECRIDFVVNELDSRDITHFNSTDGDWDEIDAVQPIIREVLEQLLANANAENRQLKEELEKHHGSIDNGFIRMFFQPRDVLTSAHSDGDSRLVVNETNASVFNIFDLPSTWDMLTVCQLMIDSVRYVVSVSTNRKPPEPFCSIAVSLRKWLDEIYAKRENLKLFESMLGHLNVENIEAHNYFKVVAQALFNGPWSWTHVISWFAFCANMARGFPQTVTTEELDIYAAYYWRFIDRQYSKEIREAGGWNAFVKCVEQRHQHVAITSTPV